MKKMIPFTIVLLFFMGLLFVPPVSEANSIQDLREDQNSTLSEGVSKNIRVAVYDESNVTAPAWSSNPYYTYDFGATTDFLTSSGFDVTFMTTEDILNHELMTIDFDVFVMIDNVPRESILDYVYEFWLGGGGVLSFNSAFGYLFYSGIFVPEWAGSDMYTSHWIQWDAAAQPGGPANHTVMARHQMGQSYHPGDKISDYYTNTVVSNPAILGTSTGPEMTLFSDGSEGSSHTGWALEPDTRAGGRVVQLPGNGSVVQPGWESVIIDSVEWLAPKPKGRILFDLSHLPAYRVDPWDAAEYPGEMYYSWRDALEIRGYTFDKLYPSTAGNLTSSNLAGYDMLILPMSDYNYTNSEVSAVSSWVGNGGGLLVLGDSTYDLADKQEQNKLLGPFDIWNNYTVGLTSTIDSYEVHPIIEGCSSLQFVNPGALNYSGAAYPIWYDNTGDTAVVGQDYGSGRVILTGDLDVLGHNQIGNVDNLDFGINLANWLTATAAEVLFYVENYDLSDPYDAPAIDALNDLGIPFYMTYTEFYMNLSLHSQQWSLVILDSAWPGIYPYFDDFSSYLDTGGDLIVSWHMMDSYPSNPLYSKVGFGYSENYPDEAPMHIWSPDHGIFNYPNDYGALNFTPGYDIGEEGDLMTVYANATALAGLTETAQPGNATIILGFGGHVLWNGYLIDQLTDDLDDSTYVDAFELWQNEIAFMLQPTIDHPADEAYEEGTTGHSIGWSPSSDRPWSYTITLDSATLDSGIWNGGPLSINIDGLDNGTHVYEITVYDNVGYSASDSVGVVVAEPTTTSPTTTTNTTGGLPLDTTTLIIIAAVVGGIILLVIVILMRKKK